MAQGFIWTTLLESLKVQMSVSFPLKWVKRNPWVTLFPWRFFIDLLLFSSHAECCHGEVEACFFSPLYFFLIFPYFYAFTLLACVLRLSVQSLFLRTYHHTFLTGRSTACITLVSYLGTLVKHRLIDCLSSFFPIYPPLT